MSDHDVQTLIEEGRFAELEDRWLDQMTSGQATVDEFLQWARLLGRHKEKERAGLLLGFLADHLLEEEKWRDRYRILVEISRHTANAAKIENLKDQVVFVLKKLHIQSPSFDKILNHFHFYDIKTPDEIKPCLDKIEPWLLHDVGMLFYEQGRGVGRVLEINMNLGFVRIDFEYRKDVAVDVADSDLKALGPDHVLRHKVEQLPSLQARALSDPEGILGLLLQQMKRPLTVSELKECFNGIIPEGQWTRWWNTARKNSQVVVSGKGAQAEFSWSDSTEAADDAARKSFDQANYRKRIDLAKQHADRSIELKKYFEERMILDAVKMWEEGRLVEALEMADAFSKWPGDLNPGYTIHDVLQKSDPAKLLSQIDNANLKIRVIDELRLIRPDSFIKIAGGAFLKEENPRVLAYLFELLQKDSPDNLERVLDQTIKLPHCYPGAFAWLCQKGEQEGMELETNIIGRKLDSRFLISLLNTLDEPELSPFRNRVKKSLENGLLINILRSNMEPEAGKKAVEMLNHCMAIEDYRRDRWSNVIQRRFPDMQKKEEWIFSTRPAIERKRLELEHLIKIELPANRKAVGEAAALGDLSENHEYKAARERQEYLINRVQHLQNELSKVRVLEPGETDCSEVRPGTCVTLLQNQNQVVFTVLGPWDSNPKENIYSYQAPVGIALMGKAKGDRVDLNAGTWTIEKIEPWK